MTAPGEAARRIHAPAGSAAVQTLVAMRRARDLIDRSYAEALELGDIAAATGYSRYHLVRAFRAAYGETPMRYLSRRRVERAQELLRSTDLSVTETCHRVGFSSLGSFSSLFTEFVGVPPSQFRRSARASAPLPIPSCFVLMGGAPAPRRPGTKTATTEKPSRAPSP